MSRSRIEAILYGCALLAALGAGFYAFSDHLGREQPEPEVVPVEMPAPRAVVDEPARPPPEEPAIEVPPLPEVPDLVNEPPPPPLPRTREDERFDTVAAEMRILSRARDLLTQHPSEAFGALEEHRHLYPRGVLREEREAFAIEALVALAHESEAERRYYEFVHDFPDSHFTPHLRDMLR
jgi:hypothetical protein